MDAPEEVLIDVNAMAVGHRFMAIGDFEPSPDGTRLAYTTDSTGYRQYVLHVKDLGTGRNLPDQAERVTSVAWAADGRTLFYVRRTGLEAEQPPLPPRSRRSRARTPVRGEGRAVRARRRGDAKPRVDRPDPEQPHHLRGRGAAGGGSAVRVEGAGAARQDREYYVDHRGDRFWIRVNDRGRTSAS